MHRYTSTVQEYKNRLWKYHVKVPSDIVNDLKEKKIKRIMCSLNNGEGFHSSLMPAGEGEYFIKVNTKILSKLKLKVGSEVSVELTEDESTYGMPIAEEMKELLKNDPEADLFFHQLTPGKQRSLLYLVYKIKSSSKRLEKSFIILEHLKEQKGKLDFKMLNRDFKNKKGIMS